MPIVTADTLSTSKATFNRVGRKPDAPGLVGLSSVRARAGAAEATPRTHV